MDMSLMRPNVKFPCLVNRIPKHVDSPRVLAAPSEDEGVSDRSIVASRAGGSLK